MTTCIKKTSSRCSGKNCKRKLHAELNIHGNTYNGVDYAKK